MKRRQLIAGLGSAAAWPLAARAQQRAMPVIGYLDAGSLETRRDYVAAFHRGLSETGYFEGRNLAVNTAGRRIVSSGYPAWPPIWFAVRSPLSLRAPRLRCLRRKLRRSQFQSFFQQAPTRSRLASSPVSTGSNAVAAKRLALLHELVPAATLIAYLVNPSNPVFSEGETRELQTAARILGVRLLILKTSDPSEFEAAFATLVLERAGGVVVSGDSLFVDHSGQLVALAARHRVPTVYDRRGTTTAGGLVSYGTDISDAYRQAGIYTGRILKGERPADLPVQQVTKIELVINLKTAKALGLTIPETLLATADQVIE